MVSPISLLVLVVGCLVIPVRSGSRGRRVSEDPPFPGRRTCDETCPVSAGGVVLFMFVHARAETTGLLPCCDGGLARSAAHYAAPPAATFLSSKPEDADHS